VDRSRPRRHSRWKKGEAHHISEWAPHIADIMDLPGFENNIDHQVWALKDFVWYRSVNPKPEEVVLQLEKEFRYKAKVDEARFLRLLDMTDGDPVETTANIRASLKAVKVTPGPLLPGEEIYPREGFLGQYLNYAQETTAPLAWHFWFAVALLGAACRRNVFMQLGYRLYPNQYLFIVGDTAEGKGIAFDIATPLVYQANEVVQTEMETKEQGLGPLQGGAYPVRKVVVLTDKPTPQWLVSSLVPKPGKVEHSEAVFRGLDSVGWLANEEVSTWLGRKSEVYEGNVHIITAFYNCKEEWAAGTITRGVERLRNMCLSVICGSNMEWINRSVTPDMFAGGFIRRCMFISRSGGPRRKYLDAPPPALDPLQASVMAGQMAAWMQAEEAVEIELSENTQTLYSQFNRHLIKKIANPEDPRLHYYYLGKYNFVMKLAMVLAINRHTWHGITTREIFEEIPSIKMKGEDLDQAIFLVENEEQYLPECFARIGEHAHTIQYREILNILKVYHIKHGKPMKMSQLGAACGARRMSSDWKRRVNEMFEDLDMVKIAKLRKTGGRPAHLVWDPQILPDWESDNTEEANKEDE
jgi:hypothetical protein